MPGPKLVGSAGPGFVEVELDDGSVHKLPYDMAAQIEGVREEMLQGGGGMFGEMPDARERPMEPSFGGERNAPVGGQIDMPTTPAELGVPAGRSVVDEVTQAAAPDVLPVPEIGKDGLPKPQTGSVSPLAPTEPGWTPGGIQQASEDAINQSMAGYQAEYASLGDPGADVVSGGNQAAKQGGDASAGAPSSPQADAVSGADPAAQPPPPGPQDIYDARLAEMDRLNDLTLTRRARILKEGEREKAKATEAATARKMELDASRQKLIDANVSPWANKSTGQRIAAMISVAIGGWLEPVMGKNSAMEIINTMIAQEMEATKTKLNNMKFDVGLMERDYERAIDNEQRVTDNMYQKMQMMYGEIDRQLAVGAQEFQTRYAKRAYAEMREALAHQRQIAERKYQDDWHKYYQDLFFKEREARRRELEGDRAYELGRGGLGVQRHKARSTRMQAEAAQYRAVTDRAKFKLERDKALAAGGATGTPPSGRHVMNPFETGAPIIGKTITTATSGLTQKVLDEKIDIYNKRMALAAGVRRFAILSKSIGRTLRLPNLTSQDRKRLQTLHARNSIAMRDFIRGTGAISDNEQDILNKMNPQINSRVDLTTNESQVDELLNFAVLELNRAAQTIDPYGLSEQKPIDASGKGHIDYNELVSPAALKKISIAEGELSIDDRLDLIEASAGLEDTVNDPELLSVSDRLVNESLVEFAAERDLSKKQLERMTKLGIDTRNVGYSIAGDRDNFHRAAAMYLHKDATGQRLYELNKGHKEFVEKEFLTKLRRLSVDITHEHAHFATNPEAAANYILGRGTLTGPVGSDPTERETRITHMPTEKPIGQ